VIDGKALPNYGFRRTLVRLKHVLESDDPGRIEVSDELS